MEIIESSRAPSKSRGQSAVELITTYAWAILILVLFLSIAFIYSASNSQITYTPATCYIQPLLPCPDTLMVNVGNQQILYAVEFINNLQQPMFFPYNAINVTLVSVGEVGVNYYLGNCTPQFASPGDTVFCRQVIRGNVRPSPGTRISTYFSLTYEICGTTIASCGSSLYKSSGTATQTISTQGINLYALNITIMDYQGTTYKGRSGSLLINGVPYSDAQNAIFITTGNFVLYAQPPTGYSFITYNVFAGTSTLLSKAPANSVTTFTLLSNTTLNVSYTSAVCNLCYPTSGPGGAPVCPASCSVMHAATCTAGAGNICQKS